MKELLNVQVSTDLSVVDLKEICKKVGIVYKGKKIEVVSRIKKKLKEYTEGEEVC
jgi:ABC-type dipeptide/oligopeptide/nickel transport system ATPase component